MRGKQRNDYGGRLLTVSGHHNTPSCGGLSSDKVCHSPPIFLKYNIDNQIDKKFKEKNQVIQYITLRACKHLPKN